MKLWSKPDKEQRDPAKSVCVGSWVRRLVLFTLVGLFGPYLQGYQDELLTVSIVDFDGGAVPNVEVVLRREGKLLPRMKTGADGRASARVGRGPVTLSIHQTGYIPIEQVVNTRSMSEPVLEIRILPVPQARETVNVQAATEDISEQSSSPGVSIEPTEANESPSRPLTLTDALPLVPGVVRAPNGQTQIEGSGEMHSALLINSIDVSDPATGRFGLSVPIDVVDSLHVLTSPYQAQYGRFTAGVVTAETRSGGNKWHFDLNDPLPEFRIRSGHLRGLKSATPRISFGGPIVQNRALFSEALEFVDNKIPIRTLPFPFNETKITSVNSFTQTDFTLTPRQTLTASFHAAPQSIRYANLDFFSPQEVTPNDDTRSYTGAITHRLAIGEGLLQSTFSLSDIATTISPQGNLGMTVLPTGTSGNYFADQQRHSQRFEWNELWSLKSMAGLGMHKIQFGSSVASTNDEGQLHAKTITMFDGQGVKLRTIDFTPGTSFNRGDLQPAVFVQDHWTFNSHLAVDAGIRAEAQTITATTRIAPRIGFVWSPTAGERTTVRGGIGAFYDSVPLNVYAFSHYPEQIITTYQLDGTVVGTPQHYLNLTSEAAASEFPFVDRDHKIGNFAPYTVAWNLEAEHRFSEHLTMRAKYLESHGSGLVTISPKVVQGQNAFVLVGDGSSKYRQFELTAQLSLQPNNRIYASYVRSLSKGTLNESDTYLGDFSSPFIRGDLYTNRAGDLPNRFLTWGSVALPWKVKVYPMIEWRSGFPYQSVDVYQNYIQSMKADSARFPTYFSADARVAKDIKLNSKYTLRPSISITNITNHFNALEVHANTADPQYGQFFGNYDRHMRFDLDLVF
ncbi:MAG: hypothetical protein JWQ42_638 [Edaphobacter sp.]|nr:hypothetical protein [Edaphobacter sp.]